MENAVVYARYSSHNQTEKSIEDQISAAQDYAVKHDYKIIATYADRAKTGTNDRRAEFQRMLSDCKKHKFTVIIVWKVDRFGRNREEITFNKYKAKKEGVRVEYVAESIGEGNESIILESVLEGMAEYYSKQLSTNVKRGQKSLLLQGKYIWSKAPLGYKVVDRKLVIDPDEAETVRTIFREYLAGSAPSTLARKYHMHHSSIYNILKNEKYIGRMRYCGEVIDICEPIIDQRTFDKANEKIKISVKSRNVDGPEYILTGKFMDQDGNMFKGSTGSGCSRKYRYYTIKGRRNIRQEYVEDAVVDYVKNTLGDSGMVDKLADMIVKAYKEDNRSVRKIKQLENALQDNQKVIVRLRKAVEDGMPYEVVKDRLEELLELRKGIQEDYDMALSEKPFEISKEKVSEFLNIMPRLKTKKSIVDTFVESVVIDDNDQLTIKLRLIGDGVLIKSVCFPTLEAIRTGIVPLAR